MEIDTTKQDTIVKDFPIKDFSPADVATWAQEHDLLITGSVIGEETVTVTMVKWPTQ